MTDWRSIVEEQILKAIGDGTMKDLPGVGKPLRLDDDPHTPTELRLAHKLLKENDLAPEWIVMGREIERQRDLLRQNMQRGMKAYKGALGDAARLSDAEQSSRRRERAEATWRTAQQAFDEAIQHLNRAILAYNLKVPPGIDQKPLLDLQRELQRLQ